MRKGDIGCRGSVSAVKGYGSYADGGVESAGNITSSVADVGVSAYLVVKDSSDGKV